MNPRILLPLFAALLFTGTARSQSPDQPQPGSPPPGGPMADRLKHRIEELHRDGKHEEAERLERHAKEMWAHRRGNAQGQRGEQPRGGTPPANPGERAAHLAEAAKHLRAAGIQVSPEQLERLGHRAPGEMRSRQPGSPDQRAGNLPSRPHLPPMADSAPGGRSQIDEIRNELRALARQVQELRSRQQSSARQGEAKRGEASAHRPMERGPQRPRDGEPQGDRPHSEQRGQHAPAPGQREGQRRPEGGNPPPVENPPRGEARPANPPSGEAS